MQSHRFFCRRRRTLISAHILCIPLEDRDTTFPSWEIQLLHQELLVGRPGKNEWDGVNFIGQHFGMAELPTFTSTLPVKQQANLFDQARYIYDWMPGKHGWQPVR